MNMIKFMKSSRLYLPSTHVQDLPTHEMIQNGIKSMKKYHVDFS